MGGWKSIVETGDRVDTPLGQGVVRRISANQGTAQVEIDGQLYDVPQGDITKEQAEAEAKPANSRPYAEGEKIEVGDRVKHKYIDEPDNKGTVTEVTQRSVRVQWDADGKIGRLDKKQVPEIIEKLTDEEQKDEHDQPEQKREDRTKDEVARDTADDLYGLLRLKEKLEQKIDDAVDGELQELREQVKRNQKLEVKVGDEVNVVQGLRHKQLEQLVNYALLRLSPLLVGMAGTGKTHAAEQVATALGLPFYSISVGAQTTKTDIMGYMAANGDYVRTHFRDAYENGGVFLMDEIDAGNANVLITINAALSNGLAAFPDAMVKKHDDFVFIASANTFGNGANRQYVGRNQLDAATLDRFAIIEWFIDDDLEESLAVGLNGKAWYMAVRAARDYVAEKKIRALISPRATQKGSKLLNVGQDLNEVIDATMLGSVPDDKKQDVRQVATQIFNKFASEVPKDLPVEVDPPTAADLIKTEDVPF